MFTLERDEDTICAVITAPGVGGISVIRVSGPKALEVCRRVVPSLPQQPESHRVYYGYALEIESDVAFDEILASYFAKGRSFTMEESVELSCHGGQQISALLLRQLILSGARMAEPGEFTYRAFMNGRIDLVQAESVLSLIQSRSPQASKLALRQLRGDLSQKLEVIEDRLIWVQAHFEANIDFSEEDIDVCDWQEIRETLKAIDLTVKNLLKSYDSGRLIIDGFRVAIVGAPNVGKSSLLNCLVGEERAIVTPVAGTTRDRVEGQFSVGGTSITLVDTAGIRESDDQVEKMGIQRSKAALNDCDFLLWVQDLSQAESAIWIDEIGELSSDQVIVIGNKLDELTVALESTDSFSEMRLRKTDQSTEEGRFLARIPSEQWFLTSAKTGQGIESLKSFFSKKGEELISENSAVLIQNRHFELLSRISEGLTKTLSVIGGDSSPEFLVFELQESILALHELMGKQFDDQVMDRVFKEFCLGK